MGWALLVKIGIKPFGIAFRMNEGGNVTSLDKSVFFLTQQDFDYGYALGVRDKNTSNLDQGVLNVNGNFETGERRTAIGFIAIHVGDLLISGSDMFIEYIAQRMKESPKWVDMKKNKRRIWA